MTEPSGALARDSIAVVGMACRFPGAANPAAFWRDLFDSRESVRFFSDEELLAAGVDPARLLDPGYVKAAPVLEHIEQFDARLFRYSPKEAELIDPQHRVFLECCWEAFENAGYDPQRHGGPVGVFAGCNMNRYLLRNLVPNYDWDTLSEDLELELGNEKDYLATRVSYKLNLKGPSVTIQTACSTSLVAVHFAMQSLQNFQCDMALAGGVSVLIPQKTGYQYREGSIVSPDGRCRAFDAAANGTIFGSGAGVVVLKRLEDAAADGDAIRAVILGSAVNNDGAAKAGFTAPSVSAQAEVIAGALAAADVPAESITYVEAHGTGTPIGDPIEVAALTQAFRSHTEKERFCAIGSVKTGIGHLDVASGIAGLIKTILALENRTIPASLHYRAANPQLKLEHSPFYVNGTRTDWPDRGFPRRAGVSSFGMGGTNAHVILQEAPEDRPSGPSRAWKLVTLSAATLNALETRSNDLARYLEEDEGTDLADAAYTLNIGRQDLDFRRFFLARDRETALHRLHAERRQETVKPDLPHLKNPDIVFMFPGQGSQYVNMGRELYDGEPTFRQCVDLCSSKLRQELNLDLRTLLYPPADRVTQEAFSRLSETAIAQPALFVVEYALSCLLESWGIQPRALVGHSIGEYVAACVAGVMTLEEALRVVAARGRLMQELPEGAMLAVSAAAEHVLPFLPPDIALAAVNARRLCVVSGKRASLEALREKLQMKTLDCKFLHTSRAFHSPLTEPVLGEFSQIMSQISLRPPQIPVLSNLTGTYLRPEEALRPGYWAEHLRHAVQFSNCLDTVSVIPGVLLLEVGPGRALSSLAKMHLQDNPPPILASMRHPEERRSDFEILLHALGSLWASGVTIDWKGFYQHERRHRIPLPTYPFQRERYWIDAPDSPRRPITSESAKPPVRLADIREPDPGRPAEAAPAINVKVQQIPNPEANALEGDLVKLWRQLLGVNSVAVTDNYFDLGGTSLMAVTLFSQIERKFGKRLPLATLYRAPTIRELASLLQDDAFKPSWKSLVKIQDGGPGLPLFLMHAEGGNVLRYSAFARHLGQDYPIYGLQAAGLEGTEIVSLSVEDMAGRFIAEIKTVQAQGPYLLAGYCLGGLVAFEMARQLELQDERIAFLALISAPTPDYEKRAISGKSPFATRWDAAKSRLAVEFDMISNLKGKKAVLHLRDSLRRLGWRAMIQGETLLTELLQSAGVQRKRLSRLFILQESIYAGNRAYALYQPRTIGVPFVTIAVKGKPPIAPDDPTLGWGDSSRHRVDHYLVNGYHKTVMNEPYVSEVAQILRHPLRKASVCTDWHAKSTHYAN